MKRVDKITVLGPTTSARESYDTALVGPPGPRGLKGDPGPKGDVGEKGEQGIGGVLLFIPLVCHNDLTKHNLSIVLDGGVYTYAISQTAENDDGSPQAKTIACVDDGTFHDLRIGLESGVYVLEVAQTETVGLSAYEAAVPLICVTDGTVHYLTVRFDGVYTLAVSQAAGNSGGVNSVFGETGGITSVDYITLRCATDNTFHTFRVVLDGGQHVLQREDA